MRLFPEIFDREPFENTFDLGIQFDPGRPFVGRQCDDLAHSAIVKLVHIDDSNTISDLECFHGIPFFRASRLFTLLSCVGLFAH